MAVRASQADGAARAGALRGLGAGLLFLGIAAGGWRIMEADRQAFTTFVMRGDPGPFLLPRLLLAAVGAAGLWLVARGGLALAGRPAGAGAGPGAPRRERVLAVLLPAGFLASVGAMPLLMQALGSLAAMALFAVAWIGLLGLRASGPRPGVAAAAVGFGLGAALMTQAVFVRLLNVPLPQ